MPQEVGQESYISYKLIEQRLNLYKQEEECHMHGHRCLYICFYLLVYSQYYTILHPKVAQEPAIWGGW